MNPLAWLRIRFVMFTSNLRMRGYQRALSDENLSKARQELLRWRSRYGLDYRGRPLPAPRCLCGAMLQLWPYNSIHDAGGIWCASYLDSLHQKHGRPVMHDVYSTEGARLQVGRCAGQPPISNSVADLDT